MGNIYTIGETVYDIIFRNDEPVTAKAGGSMLNTSVSLGRLGLPVRFISEYGIDRVGDIINSFLAENGVETKRVYRFADGKTAVALAFLNERQDASYSFYKLYPEKRLEVKLPSFSPGDIVLFGAFYSLMSEIREQLFTLVKAARDSGATIVYDPNIRSPHKNEIGALRELVCENISLADIVRGSDEDFMTIFDIPDGNLAYSKINDNGCNHLVYTKSNVGVEIFTPEGKLELEVPGVKTQSTIGAGDSFNAGLIYELFSKGKNVQYLSLADLQTMVQTAISFGSHVCTHYDNYISEAFTKGILDSGS